MTKVASCGETKTHDPHEWYWKNILRRECPGLTIADCGRTDWHGPHLHGEHGGELCLGRGLGAICKHGVQALNQCDDCFPEQS